MRQLSELDVLIIDCQTTGASPAYGTILEIGWGIARASRPEVASLEAHWITLPSGHRVDAQVRRLTGYDETVVTGTLAPEEAWRRLSAAAGASRPFPTAIHFAKFELAFLRDWAMHFEPAATFPLDAVCAHAIACRLFPDLPRRSLRALAGYLGHGAPLTRRCLGHVEATAFIWQKLVAKLADLGVLTWNDLGDWLEAPQPARPRRRRYPLPSARYRSLPDEPGVYRFVRSNGDLLYVGKATSLRKRVAGHFTAGSRATERALEMLTQVHDIQITPTRTALEAALLENEEIKTQKPPYNVQLIGGDEPTWFCDRELASVSTEPGDIHRYGPLESTFSVRSFGALCKLVAGDAATPSLRARAVGAPERWGPNEAVFAEGYAVFAQRYALSRLDVREAVVTCSSFENVRRSLARVARSLLGSASSASAIGVETEIEADEATDTTGPRTWDPDRVVRHLERTVIHAYQLLQRAKWLCLLSDSTVLFREPPSTHDRALCVRGGHIVETRDVSTEEPVETTTAPVAYRPLRERQRAFDRSHYDRLRTLTTELKRVLRDNGTVAVRLGRTRWLRGDELASLLLWV